jgi:tetratricopeptide (TPR) repeat protein
LREQKKDVQNSFVFFDLLARNYYICKKYYLSKKYFLRSLKINSKNFSSFINLSIISNNLGNENECDQFIRLARENNENLDLITMLECRFSKTIENDAKIISLEKIIEKKKKEKSENDLNLSELYFTLSSLYEKKLNYEKSYTYFNQGNSIKKKELLKINLGFDSNLMLSTYANYEQIYNHFSSFKTKSSNQSSPIFIIGLPRSGSTLLEAILSSHHSVRAFGESGRFNEGLRYYLNTDSNINNFLESFLNSKLNIFDKLANFYINSLFHKRAKNCVFTDKTLFNFMILGILKLTFPRCKFIFLTRNIKDNALSILKNYFADPNVNFAYDINNLKKFIKNYQFIVSDWLNYIPRQDYFFVDYEKIVEDKKNTIKEILNFLDLPWDQDCMKHNKEKKIIDTLSVNQVRQDIYDTSINSFLLYNNHLSNFFKDLD